MSEHILQTHVIISVAAATLILAITTYFYFSNRKKTKTVSTPQHWTLVGKVTKICIHPLKYGHRLELRNANCTIYGLITTDENEIRLRDRSFMVYDEGNYEFKTAAAHSKMVLIETSAHDREYVLFDAPKQRSLYVKVPNLSDAIKIQITLQTMEKIDGLDCGDEAATWFSRFILDKPSGLRLAYFDENFNNENLDVYSDSSSCLLVNQSSINHLNENFEEPITENSFRANILVEGETISPFAEELWDWIKIGTPIFRNANPRSSSSLVNVNSENGIQSPNLNSLGSLERLNTLKDSGSIEIVENVPVMGIYMELKSNGHIAVGDKVYIPAT